VAARPYPRTGFAGRSRWRLFGEAGRAAAVAAYDAAFGLLLPKECPPYETEYCPQTFTVYRAQKPADIAGYYRAFGVEPSREQPERPDHLAVELEFMVWLIEKTWYALDDDYRGDVMDNVTVCREAQRSFLAEHLTWWTPAFALALRRKVDGIEDERQLTADGASLYGAVGGLSGGLCRMRTLAPRHTDPTVLVAPAAAEDSRDGCADCN
jgi:nitrate reductase assembly molybdenum cofactor insertion protein NarJ